MFSTDVVTETFPACFRRSARVSAGMKKKTSTSQINGLTNAGHDTSAFVYMGSFYGQMSHQAEMSNLPIAGNNSSSSNTYYFK